ncbi:alpha/beta hydrolase [Crossiella sp. CA-258035]|uniref:alpha/beta hydrolase n=1 Tax=Crossiella sp. CA-258035 TaxID=2981138 RepID=UPI0024BCC66A|nr:alpha/beta hydrolase [Crossiella sp. CA-258035]WHT18179.1 alpha/beta hydrolase [Crossiella sp. CA-258035]
MPEEPRKPARRGWLLPALATPLLLLALAAAWLLFFDRQPSFLPALVLRAFPLHVLALSLLAVVVLLLALRKRRWRTSIAAAVAVALSAATGLVPTIIAREQASRAGAEVGLGTYLANAAHLNMGSPEQGRTVRYAAPGGHGLDLDVWPSADPGSGKAVLLIHGGGWASGNRSMTPEWNRLLTGLGYTVFDIEYRMVRDMPPGTAWRATVSDSRCALAWITAHAAEYRVDPNRISVMGQSAGGHLSLMTAYTTGTDAFRPSCDLPDGKIRSVVDFYGPFDLPAFATGPDGTDTGRAILNDVLGGSAQQQPDRYREFSPSSYLRGGLPPTLIVQGERDFLMPQSQARQLDEGLTKAGVPHQALFLPYADHGFDVNWGSYQTQLARSAVTRFLAEHG